VPNYQMRYDVNLSSISETGAGRYMLMLYNQADNNDPSLPTGWRRWWHLRVDALSCPLQQTCTVSVPLLYFHI